MIALMQSRALQKAQQDQAFALMATDLLAWTKSFKVTELVPLLRSCLIEGGERVDGRKSVMHLFGSPSSACRCKAPSKRSGEQCRKAAMRGKAVCLAHGGASTVPRTAAGRARCAEARGPCMAGRRARCVRFAPRSSESCENWSTTSRA